MNEPSNSTSQVETVVIVGVGLIGGSLAAAVKRRKLARRIIGVGRNTARIQSAQAAGLIDEAVTDVRSVVAHADLIVFCTPVDSLAADIRQSLNGSAEKQGTHIPLLTDVGSVKSPICEDLADVPSFIGSHPIAGSHRQGFEASDADLFEGRTCVLTPLPSSSATQVDRLTRFWQSVGMRTVQMSPAAHDQALAMTSHLPHVVAAALATTLSDDNRLLTGTGFRDTTRIAAGDPDLWTAILMNNADQIAKGIDLVQQRLAMYLEALTNGDSTVIRQLLSNGQASRKSLD